MLKKLTYLVLSLLLLFSATACKKDKDDDKAGQTITTPETTLAEYFDDIFGGNVSITMNISVTQNQEAEPMFTMMIMLDGDKEYSMLTGFMNTEEYVIKEGDFYYNYIRVSQGEWERLPFYGEENALEGLMGDLFETPLVVTWFDYSNNQFTLKSEYFSNVFGEDSADMESFVITMADSSMVWTIRGSDDDDDMEMVFTITNIGSTVIQVPDFSDLIADNIEPLLVDTLAPDGENRHTITIDVAGYYEIFVISNFDSYGVLETTTGQVLDFDDDSNGNLDFNIYIELQPGTYVVIVTGYDEDEYGQYGLYVVLDD